MKNIKLYEEFIIPDIDEDVLEMARININDGFPNIVIVNGGNSYGAGRKEHGEPHFHYLDKFKGGQFSFSVLIPTVEEWNTSKELYISETTTGYFNWNGFRKEYKGLVEWLGKPNASLPRYTNLETIRSYWNTLNIDNNNVKQLGRIT